MASTRAWISLVGMLGSKTTTFGPNGAAAAGPAPSSRPNSVSSAATSPTRDPVVRSIAEPPRRLRLASRRDAPAWRVQTLPLQRREVAESARRLDHVEQQAQPVRADGGVVRHDQHVLEEAVDGRGDLGCRLERGA